MNTIPAEYLEILYARHFNKELLSDCYYGKASTSLKDDVRHCIYKNLSTHDIYHSGLDANTVKELMKYLSIENGKSEDFQEDFKIRAFLQMLMFAREKEKSPIIYTQYSEHGMNLINIFSTQTVKELPGEKKAYLKEWGIWARSYKVIFRDGGLDFDLEKVEDLQCKGSWIKWNKKYDGDAKRFVKATAQ